MILSALPFSFDAGFSQLTTAFSVGAHVVLLNYLLPADVVQLCARHRVTGLTGVPPLWIQIAEQDWPAEVAGHLRYFANTGGRMPKATLDKLRSLFPGAKPYLMYGLTEAFRSTYLDPAEVDRRPDRSEKPFLTPRSSSSVRTVRCASPARKANWCTAARSWPWGTGTIQNAPPSASVPLRRVNPVCVTEEIAVWSGDAVVMDEEGFLFFVGRKDDMIKTSGYRVSPTRSKKAAYDTGLVRDAVAARCRGCEAGPACRPRGQPGQGRRVDVDALLARMRNALPLYMLPKRVDVRSDIPRSPNGKFDRTLLRKELTA